MATPNEFRYYLMADSLYYYWDGVTVQTTTDPRNIGAQPEAGTYTPDGWKETEIKWGRNIDYRTLLRTFSTPYKFAKDGAQILRYVKYREGIEGKCKLYIKKRRSSDWGFNDYYLGDIDFLTFQDNITDVTVEITEGGLSAQLKAYATTPQEVPLSTQTGPVIKLYSDGIKLRGTANYLTQPASLLGNAGQGMLAPANVFTIQEGDYPVVVNQSAVGFNMGGYTNSDFSGSTNPQRAYDNYLQSTLQTITQVVHVNHPNFYYKNVATGAAQTIRFTVELIVAPDPNNDGTPQPFSQRQILFQDVDLGEGQQRTLNIDVYSQPITMNKYDRIYVVYYAFKVSGDGAAIFDFVFPEGKVEIQSTFQLPSSVSQSIRLATLYQYLCSTISGSLTTAKSDFLNTPGLRLNDWKPYYTVATCGDALRGLFGNVGPAGKYLIPKIKSNLAEFLEAMQALAPVGLGIEGDRLVLEIVDYFFDRNTMAYDLGEVTDLKIVDAEEYYASNIRIGYENQTYDGLNGRDEFNTSQAYKMPITRATEPADFVSPYRADGYGMEIYRANLSGKKTTDSSSDNDTFIVTISPTPNANGEYPLSRLQNTAGALVNGVLFPESAINLEITPKRNFNRQGSWLRMMTYLQNGGIIKFQTTDKNPDVISNLGSGSVIENSDVPVATLPSLPFLPVYIQCQAAKDNINEILSSYPKGYFRMTYNGVELKGFFDSGGVRPAKLDLYNFQFLAHPDMDMAAVMAEIVRKQQ